jgi:hypothetical protein
MWPYWHHALCNTPRGLPLNVALMVPRALPHPRVPLLECGPTSATRCATPHGASLLMWIKRRDSPPPFRKTSWSLAPEPGLSYCWITPQLCAVSRLLRASIYGPPSQPVDVVTSVAGLAGQCRTAAQIEAVHRAVSDASSVTAS